jgi:hypothetical protein
MQSPAPFLRAFARIALGLFSLACVSRPHAQTALEPADGGIDFRIQGEYVGQSDTGSSVGGGTPLGVQVVALGGGQFQAIFLAGGLPGQGWNGKDRAEVSGSLQTDKAVFTGTAGGYSATIASDGISLAGKNPAGGSFTLDKINRVSPTFDAPPPSGAVVLFNGNGVDAWKDGTATMDDRKFFKPEGSSASSGAITKQSFQSFTLHLEFREPFMPAARGQRRGNSGIYLQGRDEVQVLDSFGTNLEGNADTLEAKRQCGAFFEYFRPTLNMCFPPLSWQTYDIEFTAARYDAAGKAQLETAYATVRFNGITVQTKSPVAAQTLLGELPGPTPGPFRFQAYGDPVYYRNIWVTEGATSVRRRFGSNPSHRIETDHPFFMGASRLDGRSVTATGTGKSAHADRLASGWYLVPGDAGKQRIGIRGN